jgi:hypothetical protein
VGVLSTVLEAVRGGDDAERATVAAANSLNLVDGRFYDESDSAARCVHEPFIPAWSVSRPPVLAWAVIATISTGAPAGDR